MWWMFHAEMDSVTKEWVNSWQNTKMWAQGSVTTWKLL